LIVLQILILTRFKSAPVSGEKCRDCPHLKFCMTFKAKTSEYRAHPSRPYWCEVMRRRNRRKENILRFSGRVPRGEEELNAEV